MKREGITCMELQNGVIGRLFWVNKEIGGGGLGLAGLIPSQSLFLSEFLDFPLNRVKNFCSSFWQWKDFCCGVSSFHILLNFNVFYLQSLSIEWLINNKLEELWRHLSCCPGIFCGDWGKPLKFLFNVTGLRDEIRTRKTECKPLEHDTRIYRQDIVPCLIQYLLYWGADKSLARPGRKKLQRRKFLRFIYPIYNRNWRNISTIFIYNKTSIKRNILTIK